MVALQYEDKERIYFHLGYGAARLGSDGVSQGGIDAADLAQVEEACDNITSSYMETAVLDQLDVCDLTYKAMQLAKTDSVRFSIKEAIIGDTNRSIERQDVRDIRKWREEYIEQTNELAMLLACTNYRAPGMHQYRYSRSGGSYIKVAAAMVPDTSVASKRAEYLDLYGNAGV